MKNESTITRLLHADRRGGVEHGALHKPMHTAVAFGYATAADLIGAFQGTRPGHIYARQGNPTVSALEEKITLLEGGRASAAFGTGMAALGAILLSLIRAGDHVVCSRFIFGNTNSMMLTLQGFGVEVSFVDACDAAQVQASLKPNTRLVFVETIANPRTQVADLAGIGALCAARGLLYVVDSTLTPPCLFQARSVQAGFVLHSLSKALSGQGDALGGSVTDTGLFDWSGYPNIAQNYRRLPVASWGMQQLRKKGLRDFGGSLRAEDAHRIGLGLETLALRTARACANALALARHLESHPAVRAVYYPGLASHPQHDRAASLFGASFGTLLSFELQEGVGLHAVLDALKIVILSSHVSDTRTLAIPVAQTIFHEAGPERRAQMGIADDLIRVTVGIEDPDDLIADFDQALASGNQG